MGVYKIFARSIKFEEFEVGLTTLNRKARLKVCTFVPRGKGKCCWRLFKWQAREPRSMEWRRKRNGESGRKQNGGANREDQTAKKGIYENQNDNQQVRSKEICSFDHLPNDLITMIFETALRSSNPSDACIRFQGLRNVSSRFRRTVPILSLTCYWKYTIVTDLLV